ncbi:site-specific integrase [Dyadobacter sp. CY261]|uniref:site-specific integrase n=1 Tax=Dyadobacter sp. CY261 TaxID=2907203 RepID=UPI001F432C95|nr:site-specific integrase [Dyadobacter sp. CY261]MCF0071811.1 site-specific integrase [Dyadobacter sp. CY261]
MDSTVKVVLRKKKREDGSYPLALRVTTGRTSTYIYLKQYLKEGEWDTASERVKKSHPNSVWLNNLILARKAEVNDQILQLATQKKDTTAAVVRKTIKRDVGIGFFAQAQIYTDQLEKNGKFNRKSADLPRINRFKEFLKGNEISFADINPGLLRQFQAYLRSKRKVTERTVVNHLVVIRTVFNQAITAGVADSKHYPFGKGKIAIKFPDSARIGLTAEEVKLLEDAELTAGQHHARNLWLISFYFAGMRVSDVLRLKWSDFQNDRLYYSMGKNLKAGSLKVPEKAMKILKQYSRDSAHNLVFPDLGRLVSLNNSNAVQSYIKTRVKSCNDYLKQIAEGLGFSKPLTMHIARHTFAQISSDKIPVNILQRLYRHSDIKTTMGYQSNFINKATDDALDAVINI